MLRADRPAAKDDADRLLREARRCFELARETGHDTQIVLWLEALGRLMARRARDMVKATLH